MDTSIRLASFEDVLKSTEQSRRTYIAALEILSTVKPYTTYLSGFVTLERYISSTSGLTPWDTSPWELAEYQHKFPDEIWLGTWVRGVKVLVNLNGKNRLKNGRRVHEKSWSYQKNLLLTRESKLLVWDLTISYERKGKKRTATVRSKFRVLQGKPLFTYLNEGRTAQELIANLGWCVTDTVESRRNRLKATEELEKFVRGVEQLLNPR